MSRPKELEPQLLEIGERRIESDIERKFISPFSITELQKLGILPPDLSICSHIDKEQYYLDVTDECKIRIRRKTLPDGKTTYLWTKKTGKGGTRTDEKVRLTPEEFEKYKQNAI